MPHPISYQTNGLTLLVPAECEKVEFWSKMFGTWKTFPSFSLFACGDIVRAFFGGRQVEACFNIESSLTFSTANVFEVVSVNGNKTLTIRPAVDPSLSPMDVVDDDAVDFSDTFARERDFDDFDDMLAAITDGVDVAGVRTGFLTLDDGTCAAVVALGDNGEGAPDVIMQIEPLSTDLQMVPVIDEALEAVDSDAVDRND